MQCFDQYQTPSLVVFSPRVMIVARTTISLHLAYYLRQMSVWYADRISFSP